MKDLPHHHPDTKDLQNPVHQDASLTGMRPYATSPIAQNVRLNQLRMMLYNTLPTMKKVKAVRNVPKNQIYTDKDKFLLSSHEAKEVFKTVDEVSNHTLERLNAIHPLNWAEMMLCALILCKLQNHAIMLLTGMKEDYIKKIKWRLKRHIFKLPLDKSLYEFLTDFQYREMEE